MIDFGLIEKAIDYVKGSFQHRKDKVLRERFLEIFNKLEAAGTHTYRPAFGSAEYWEALEMAKHGWLVEIDHGFTRQTMFHRDSLHSFSRRY